MDSVHVVETNLFINQVLKTCNHDITELERSKIIQTYNRWYDSLFMSGSTSERKTTCPSSVSLTDLFRCLIPEIKDIYKILDSNFTTVPQCNNLVDSIHFRQEDIEDIYDKKKFNLPQLKERTGVILLCKIVPAWFEDGNSISHICVSDDTDDIPCQVPGPLGKDILTVIGRWVLIASFNNISQKDKRYIEVCQRPIPVYPVNVLENVSVVSTEDAKCLLKYKELLNIDSVNVLVEVVAVSEIFRVKSDLIFCIQLTGNINIIIKKKEYLYWQSLIVPKEEYVFTNMKPTTLKKGTGENIKVFVPWNDSRVLPKYNTNCLVMTLEQLLKSKGISIHVIPKLKQTLHDEVAQEMSGRQESFCNYQGTITSTQHAKLGFYILDDKIGLFTCCVPAVYTYNTLRVGMKIVVYNAHMMSSLQEPKLRIMCCLSSCIKILEFPDVESKVMEFDPIPYFQHLFWKYGLNMVELDCIVSMYYSLVNKLYPYYTRNIEEILKILLQSVLDKTDLCQRNFLQEFLTESLHDCCISKKKEQVYMCDKVPELQDVICEEKFSRNLKLEKYNGNDGGNWKYTTVNASRGHILIGKLQLSPVTGKIQLCDLSGQINCVIAEILDGQSGQLCTTTDHRCTTKCQNIYEGLKPVCPWISPSFIGSIISLSNFVIVTENFLSNENQTDGSSSLLTSDNVYTYITFSMKDVLFLKVPSQNHCNLSNGINMCRKRKWQEDGMEKFEHKKNFVHDNGVNLERTVLHEQIVLIEHVESLILEGKRNNPQLRFSAIGFILDKEDLESDAGHEIISMMLSDKIIKDPPISEASGESNIIQDVKDVSVSGHSVNTMKTDMNANVSCDYTKATENTCTHSKEVTATATSVNIPLKEVTATATSVNAPSKEVTATATSVNAPSKEVTATATSVNAPSKEVTATATSVNAPSKEVTATATSENTPSKMVTAIVNSRPPHIILFQGNAIQWYSCIFPGGVYKITSCNKPIDISKTRVTSWHLKRAAAKAGGKSCIVLPEDISCERILSPIKCNKCKDCGFCNDRSPPVVLIKDILTENFSEVLVSFICQIRSRTHVKPDFITTGKITQNEKLTKLGVSVLRNMAIQLQVQCVSSGEIILVYMNLDNSSYLFGLLPGAVVHFHKMERKISKTGKIYCQYITVSSVRVLKYLYAGPEQKIQRNSETEKFRRTETDKIPKEKAPQRYLSEFWGRFSDVDVVFKCVCHVQKVLKISLKCVCQICGTMVTKNRCSNQLCENDTEMKFLARASLIVEDSTGVAIVTCADQDLKNILVLSDEEWGCLQNRIRFDGEVFLQQMSLHNTDYSPLERFVILLCENFYIKRPIEMILSVQTAVRNKGIKTSTDVDEMELDDFAVKSVDTGISTFDTRCLPFLQLDCHCVQDLNYSEWTLYNLSDMT